MTYVGRGHKALDGLCHVSRRKLLHIVSGNFGDQLLRRYATMLDPERRRARQHGFRGDAPSAQPSFPDTGGSVR